MKIKSYNSIVWCVIAVLAAIASLAYLIDHPISSSIVSVNPAQSRQLKVNGVNKVIIKRPLSKNRKDPRDIQYAAFGASTTWGTGIIGDRDKLTYPKLLSGDAANYAIRATGPGYPAACTQTMIGDRHFDVIILEFFSDGTEGLPVLAWRLRLRFPDAIIIILREWIPLWIYNEKGVGASSWVLERGFTGENNIHDSLMHEAFRSSNHVWSFPDAGKRIKNQEDVARKYGAFILEMEKPTDPKNWVDYHQLFHSDYQHKSNDGHREVAERIRKLVDKLGVPKNSRIGKWESMDSCNTWFDSGHVTGLKTSPGWRLSRFSLMEKYALELHSESGSITVHNPSQKPMNVYVAYMITNPAPTPYPKMTVSIINQGTNEGPPIALKQKAPFYYANYAIHIHILEKVGEIAPGNAVLNFKQLESSHWPFRIVSIAITNEEIMGSRGQPDEITTWICQQGCTCFRKGTNTVSGLYRC